MGITSEELLAMPQACEACGASAPEDGRSLCVDHDHETGRIRGILCHGCNTALGLLNEDPARALWLMEYTVERCQAVI